MPSEGRTILAFVAGCDGASLPIPLRVLLAANPERVMPVLRVYGAWLRVICWKASHPGPMKVRAGLR